MFKEHKHEFEIVGKQCSFSTGFLARKSQASVFAKMGDTSVLVTVNVGSGREDADFFPLSVEYIESRYAAGKIAGSRFVKRERFPTDDAVLKARMIDRSIRPRFPSDYRNEVQVIVKVLTYDEANDPLIIAMNAASAALMMSKAPYTEPVSAVRVGLVDDKFTAFNAHVDRIDMGDSDLNLFIAGDGKSLTNIDSNSNEVPEDRIIESMEYGLELMQPWLEAQKTFVALQDKVEIEEYHSYALPEDLLKDSSEKYASEIAEVMVKPDYNPADKDALVAKMIEEFSGTYSKADISAAYEYHAKKITRKLALEDGKRIDGRAMDEIRELDTQVGILPKVHGTGVFSRGLTQALTIATLGSSRNQLTVDDMTTDGERNYMHYYMDAPYAFGEAGRYKYVPGRREVGHGALAEKALYPVLPSMEEFPYTIILASEIMSEEGSSSMAATCGSTLALMDAGVPIKRPVAGIAMGVMINEDDMSEFKVLTDIQGIEDFYGFMDFKVTGTVDGVTAIQMDTKSAGLPIEIFKAAIVDAKKARMTVIAKIEEAIDKPRDVLAATAPKVARVKIPTEKIGELIGPGGKNIKKIQEDHDVELDIEEDGNVNIFSGSQDVIDAVTIIVEGYAFVPELGAEYDGTVVRIVDFGAFVELAPGTDGLVHVSEITDGFVKDVNEFVSEGESVKVKVLGLDDGKIKLTMKGGLNPEVDKKAAAIAKAGAGDSKPRGDRRY